MHGNNVPTSRQLVSWFIIVFPIQAKPQEKIWKPHSEEYGMKLKIIAAILLTKNYLPNGHYYPRP